MIILVFVFFGLPSEMGGAGSIAKVNNAFISLVDFQQEEQRIRQYYSSMFGGGFDFSSQRQLLRQQALESLVRSEVVQQAAGKEGILATDAEVRDFIVKDIPAFQQNGFFQRDFYLRYLESTRSTPGDFENKVRKDILNLRVRRLFEASAWPLQIEQKLEERLKGLKVNYQVASIDDTALKGLSISEDNISKSLSDEEFKKRVQTYFDKNKAEFEQAEQVRAQHILISVDPAQADSEEKALAKVKEVQAQLKNKDFGALAAQYSDDPGSKNQKGDLGFFEKGSMVPEFEEVAFSAPVGQVSEPVKTNFGFHLIKVNEKKKGTVAELSKVQRTIAKTILSQDQSQELMKRLEDALAQGNESETQSILNTLKVSWKETGLVSVNQETWPQLNSVVAKEAALETSKAAPLLKRLVRDGGQKFVIRLKEFKEDGIKPAQTPADQQLAQRKRSEGLFEAWTTQFRSKSDVEMNQQLLNSFN
jgi:parvulin-like peptidyl-prolyl isomerase